jgi:perosamine synthetase
MIPVSEPVLGARELEYVTECLRSGWISSAGHFIDEFEAGWARYCGRRHGVAVANGSVALELAVACLELGPGDEVIIPTFTIISCAQAVIARGATPVLVDADPRTLGMDPAQVAARVTPRTRAIMPVHLYGHPVDLDPILRVAEQHGLAVIEDAAEAHGAEYLVGHGTSDARWRRCGGFGALSCFSFYANKLITTGEGGMVVTDDDRLAARARSLRNLCFIPGRRFYHEELGYNYRFTNLQAALGLAQLERMDAIVARKRHVAAEYTQRLAGLPGLRLPAEESWARSVFWMYGVQLGPELALDAATCAAALHARGIETRPFFLGMHEQPVLQRRGLFAGERYPVSEAAARRGLYLPSGIGLTDAQVATVCDAVRAVLQ